MGLGEWTIQQLRDLAEEEGIDLGDATLKADIVAKIEAAQAEPEAEPQAEVEAVPEPVPEPEPAEDPQIKAGGYIATEKGWELAENVKG